MVKALIHSRASKSIISKEASKDLKIRSKTENQKWKTAAGQLTTSPKTKNSQFNLFELHTYKNITYSVHVVDIGISWYDMIIGRDLIIELGIDIKCRYFSITPYNDAIPWRYVDLTTADVY